MINELDDVLKTILNDSQAPSDLRNAEKSFVIPKENYSPSQATINLYLYDLHENRILRQAAPIIERVGTSFIRKPEPLRFDCSYIVTAWSEKTDDEQPEVEHKLISQAMQWLSRFPVIPEALWPVEWKDKTNASYQPFPLTMWIAQVDGVKEPGEYWAALNTPPHPFFNLTVTIAMNLVDKETDLGPEVSAKILRDELVGHPQEKYLAQIGGRVIEKDLVPIKGIDGASVTIVELDRIAKTDKDGYYIFTKIPYGEGTVADPSIEYTFKAIADKYIENEINVSVLKDDEDYTIELKPV